MPDSILRAAKDKLGELESGQSQGPAPTQTELSLVTPKQPSAALEALKALDPDELSAREALDRIYQLKQNLTTIADQFSKHFTQYPSPWDE